MALSDNQALNQMVALLTAIEKNTREGYTVVSGNTYMPSLSQAVTRPVMSNCRKAAITNIGTVACRIYVSNKLIRTLPPGETWVSPLGGTAAIKMDTAGAGTTVSLVNFLI